MPACNSSLKKTNDALPDRTTKVKVDTPKLEGEVKYTQFKVWEESWFDYCKLTKLSIAPVDE